MSINEKLEEALQVVKANGETTISLHSNEIIHLLGLVKANDMYMNTLNEGMDALFEKVECESNTMK